MIFISYRRADSESVVGRIYSELTKHFPTQDVFLDHDSIPLGKPFLDVIRERLATSKFAIILIGPRWCSIKDEKTGQARLEDPNDFVRLEVETALATPGVDVIPLWVMRSNTTPEDIAGLPTSIQALFKNNGMSLRPVPDEDGDLHRLVGRLTRQNNFTGPDTPSPTAYRQALAFQVTWSISLFLAGRNNAEVTNSRVISFTNELGGVTPENPTLINALTCCDGGIRLMDWLHIVGSNILAIDRTLVPYFQLGFNFGADLMHNGGLSIRDFAQTVELPEDLLGTLSVPHEIADRIADHFWRILHPRL